MNVEYFIDFDNVEFEPFIDYDGGFLDPDYWFDIDGNLIPLNNKLDLKILLIKPNPIYLKNILMR